MIVKGRGRRRDEKQLRRTEDGRRAERRRTGRGNLVAKQKQWRAEKGVKRDGGLK